MINLNKQDIQDIYLIIKKEWEYLLSNNMWKKAERVKLLLDKWKRIINEK